MEAIAGLVAGSHNRNELVVIRRDGEFLRKPPEQLIRKICQICGDDVGLTVDGELFVACNECAFPICRTCYEYERREGSQVCPQCKTRFKRFKGCARVDGDEEEDDIDDLENEFKQQDFALVPVGLVHDALPSQVLLLTDGSTVDDIPPEQHALVPAYGGVGKRVHPHSSTNYCLSVPVQPRPLDPSKDLAAYGYGSVAWKERMENWKRKQERINAKHENGGKDSDDDGEGPDLSL